MPRQALHIDFVAAPKAAHLAVASVASACINTFVGVACMASADHSFDTLLYSVFLIGAIAAAGFYFALAAIVRGRKLALATVALSSNLATASLFVFALCLRI
jgi:hypothetical protein